MIILLLLSDTVKWPQIDLFRNNGLGMMKGVKETSLVACTHKILFDEGLSNCTSSFTKADDSDSNDLPCHMHPGR